MDFQLVRSNSSDLYSMGEPILLDSPSPEPVPHKNAHGEQSSDSSLTHPNSNYVASIAECLECGYTTVPMLLSRHKILHQEGVKMQGPLKCPKCPYACKEPVSMQVRFSNSFVLRSHEGCSI